MAAAAAGVGLWMRDVTRDTSWSNEQHRTILGIGLDEAADLVNRLEAVHPEDRSRVAATIDEAMQRGGDCTSVRHRIVLPSGDVRWIASHGHVKLDGNGKAASVWGVTTDVTAPVRAELDAEVNRNELAHLSRVAMLGQLSGSIAHELNQPLTAILSNAQAALRFTSAATVDLEGVREILRDIVADDQRAGEVIWRLRALFERGEARSEPLVAATLSRDVVRMLRSDLISRNVNVTLDLDPTLPAIHGDAVQLQQVLLNLIFNACEAMAHSERSARALLIRAELSDLAEVAISVIDGGPGIAPSGSRRSSSRSSPASRSASASAWSSRAASWLPTAAASGARTTKCGGRAHLHDSVSPRPWRRTHPIDPPRRRSSRSREC